MSIRTTLQDAQARVRPEETNQEHAPITGTPEKAEWNRKTCMFLDVPPGVQQPYSFTYIGEKYIKKVSSSCGCTTSALDGKEVSGIWYVSADFSNVKGDTASASKEVYVTFEDDTENTLYLKATVNKLLWS